MRSNLTPASKPHACVQTSRHAVSTPPQGHTAPLDITSVVQPSTGRRYYSFLSLVFGLFANLDIGTEHQRCGGNTKRVMRVCGSVGGALNLTLNPKP
eukprot:352258-Chlamydomonas_euryale.AAC.1